MSADLSTHHNQGRSALLVGSIGSQDGNHHGNGAHDVEGGEADGSTLQLEEEEVIDRFLDTELCVFFGL